MIYSPPSTQVGLSSGVELPLPAPTHTRAESHETPSGNPGYGPVVYVSVFKHHYYTTAWRERLKEAGRQPSSFINLGVGLR